MEGHKLVARLRSPFDAFVNLGKNEEWWAVVGSLRQLHEARMAVICIHSSLLALVRDCAKQVAKFDRQIIDSTEFSRAYH